jgi:thiol-disulfide isomerase/thioredoxin
MRLITLPLILLTVTLGLLPAAEAQEDAADSTPAKQLRDAIAFITDTPAFTVDVALDFRLIDLAGENKGTVLKASLAMAEEASARYRVETSQGNLELFADGDDITVYLGNTNQYVGGGVFPDRVTALAAVPAGPFRASQMLMSDFFHGEENLYTSIENGTVTRKDSDGAEETVLHLESQGLSCAFTIQSGAQPLLTSFHLDLTPQLAPRNPSIKEATLTYRFSNWNLAPAFEDSHFAFTAPEGATEMKAPEQPKDPLVGKPAPAISLPTLDGGEFDLASHRGKHVVILDFWASWCGPCRMGLPVVAEVANAYADRDVRMFAVNCGEDKTTIQAFLEQVPFDAPIALDSERTAQRDYGANSIPKTVVVDKTGTVREVHTGLSPRLKRDLERLLDELTAE